MQFKEEYLRPCLKVLKNKLLPVEEGMPSSAAMPGFQKAGSDSMSGHLLLDPERSADKDFGASIRAILKYGNTGVTGKEKEEGKGNWFLRKGLHRTGGGARRYWKGDADDGKWEQVIGRGMETAM
eukprot:757939-Hanusia_phi.AAC.1